MFEKLKISLRKNILLISNFSYLSGLQLFQMLLPLVSYPYLIRVLGADVYGKVVFAQTTVTYFLILVNFGFNTSAIKNVSIQKDDPDKISEIFSATIILKFLLLVISFLILVGLIYTIQDLSGIKTLLLLAMWVCVYDVVFPIWYFQGKEEMKYTAIINMLARIIFLPLIFIFIKKPEDYLKVPIFNGIGAIVAGLVSAYIIFRIHKVKFKFVSMNVLRFYLKDSLPYFITNLSSKIYVTISKILVGVFLGMQEVAYYDLGEKIVNLLKTPQRLLTETLFPRLNREKGTSLQSKSLKLSLVVNLSITLIAFVFSHYFVELLGGKEMNAAVNVLRILLLTVPLIGLSSVYGIQVLIPQGYQNQYRNIVTSALGMYVLGVLVLKYYGLISVYSLATTVVITELFVAIGTYWVVKQKSLV